MISLKAYIATQKQQTRKEKRKKQRTYGLERAKNRPARDRQGTEYPNVAAMEMKELQKTDETLAAVAEGNGVFRRGRGTIPMLGTRGQPEECEVDQLILPMKLRRVVLQTVHSIHSRDTSGDERWQQGSFKDFTGPPSFGTLRISVDHVTGARR